jgi:hypothetical protein
MTIGQMFSFKDKIKNVMEQSLVVCKYTCKCGAEYIGKTERILHYRVKEQARLDVSSQTAFGQVENQEVAKAASHQL